MHITEDFLPNLMKLIKKTTWGNMGQRIFLVGKLSFKRIA